MPPLPVLCRAVLAGTLKGAPVQIQYLPSGHGLGRDGPAVPTAASVLESPDSGTLPTWPAAPLKKANADRSHHSVPASAVVEAEAAVQSAGHTSNLLTAVNTPLAEKAEAATPPIRTLETPSRLQQEQLQQSDEMLFVRAFRTFLVVVGMGMLILYALWRGLIVESADSRKEGTQSPAKRSLTRQSLLASHFAQKLGLDQGVTPKPLSLDATKIHEAPLSFATVCPPYMRASEGAELSMKLAPPEESTWSCAVLGLGAAVAVRGPPVQLLTANLRVLGDRKLLELRELAPGSCTSDPGSDAPMTGRVLLAINSDMEIWSGGGPDGCHAQEVSAKDAGTCLGTLQQLPLLGGSVGSRRMFTLQEKSQGNSAAEQAGEDDAKRETEASGTHPEELATGHPDGPVSLAVSIGATGAYLELGAMPSGRLLASAVREAADDGREHLSLSVKPHIDAVLALGCLLAVMNFACDKPDGKE